MSKEKIIELLRKVKALANRGVDGEKESAEKILNDLMQKHGISLEDIETDIRKYRYFKIKASQSTFFIQIAASVIGKGFSYKSYDKNNREFWIKLTDSEFVEVEWKMDFYWEKYQSDLEVFYTAFIQKNDLYAKENGEPRDRPEPTPEEKARLWKLMQMMSGLESHTPIKRIEATK